MKMKSRTCTEQLGIKYVPPEGQDPHQYAQWLINYNTSIQSRVRRSLESELPSLNGGIEIVTPGSDGRLEKGPESRMELSVIEDGHSDAEAIKAIETINGAVASSLMKAGSFESVRHVHLRQNELTYFDGNFSNPQPGRIIDAGHIIGNEALLKRAKILLGNEFQGPNGSKLIERIASRIQGFRKICRTGSHNYKGQEVAHFDLSKGESYYDPSKYIGGFKYGPLRFVQELIIKELVKLIRRSKDLRCLEDLPKNTMDKLLFLQSEGVLKQNYPAVQELIGIYEYFLWQLHRSQYNYCQERNGITPIDSVLVEEKLKALLALTDGGLISD